MKKLLTLSASFLILNTLSAQTGPGGVGNSTSNRIWYDTYQQNLANGSAVSTLSDFSGNGNNATQGTANRRPVYLTNQINGQNILSFDGVNDFLETPSISALNTNQLTWFIIGRANSIHTGVLLRNAYSSGAGTGSEQMWGTFIHSASSQFNSHVRRSNSNSIGGTVGYNTSYNLFSSVWRGSNSTFDRFFNGSLVASSSLADAVPTGHLRTRIGADSQNTPSFYFNGQIGEIIVYTQALNTTQRIIIENYLGNKYGLSFTNDMYAYQNTHQYEIAGIGQTSAGDNHLTSKGTGIIEISNPSAITNGSYLFWGHNNTSLSPQASDVPGGYQTRLTRNWRIGKTGTTGTVTVRIDISQISWANPSTYALLIDDDGVFSDATDILSSGFDGTYLTFNNVTLNEGDYITLASLTPTMDIISITSGPWENPVTWSCSCVPGTTANVTIDDTHVVTLNSNRNTRNLAINTNGVLTVTGAYNLAISDTFNINGTFNSGTGTVIYSGSNPQTIVAANYFNLTSNNTGTRTLSSTGTIRIAGVFTIGTNSYTVTGSTIEYNGTGSQNIPEFNYFNLSSASTGTRVLPSTGQIGIAGSFTPGTNTYTTTGSEINYNGTSAQTIAAFNYFHLRSTGINVPRVFSPTGVVRVTSFFSPGGSNYSGNLNNGSTFEYAIPNNHVIAILQYHNLISSSTGSRFTNAGEVLISGNFTPGTNTYTMDANSTFHFNGTGSQTIPVFQYASLRLSSTGQKTLSGIISISNNLTSTATNILSTGSEIVMNGTTNQSINGTLTLHNLTINKSAGNVSLGATANINLRGALSINSATNFTTNSRPFTMISDSTSTARIAPVLNGGSITGNFTIQRYVPGGNNNWMTMAAPVVSTTWADWDAELLLSGIGGGEGFFPGSPFYSVQEWSETAQDYSAITSTSSTLTPGKGFEVWMCGPTYDSFGTRPNNVLTSVGAPYIGSLNIPLSYTASGDYPGQHLVGNPYASHLNLNQLTGNIADEFYVFDDGIGPAGDYYAYWDKASQTGTGDLANSGGIIAPHQGFWVTAEAATTLGFTENMKTTSTSSSSWVGKQEIPELSVRLNQKGLSKGSRAFIRFNDVSTKNFDEFDKQFRLPVPHNIPSISMLTDDNKKLIVNSINEYEESYALPLSVKSGTQGIYQLSVNKQNITNGYNCYRIEDTKLNKIADVSNGAYYEVALNNNEKIDNRFILHISKDDCPASEAPNGIYASAIENKVGVFGHEQGAVVVFGYNETVMANISIYNTLGQLISQPLSQTISSDRVILNLPATTQVYIIKVEVNGEVLTQRIVR